MKVELFGCRVDDLSLEETLAAVEARLRAGQPCRHGAVNVDKIVKASRDPALRQALNSCDLLSADGMPVVWAARLLGTPLKARVTGIDLFEALLARAAEQGWRVYFLGARQAVLRDALRVALTRHPALQVAGHRHGYWQPQDEAQVVAQIAAAAPHILFVALDSPRKEHFLARHQAALRVPFAMGVGGSFDVLAGALKRAPVWMQQWGLEWFYRFCQEPQRLFRRYFVDDMAFFALLAREWARR